MHNVSVDPVLFFSKWLSMIEKFLFSQWFEILSLAYTTFPKALIGCICEFLAANSLLMFKHHRGSI